MIKLDNITLPNTLIFEDEFSRPGVTLEKENTVTGALILEQQAIAAGRPITIRGGPNFAWIPRSLLLSLLASADTPGEKTLDFHGDVSTVVWDHQRGAITAEQLRPKPSIQNATKYRSLVLRFLET